MIAYKLLRRLKNGDITSLYINKKRRLPVGEWLTAECYPTKGFAVRPYWHCTSQPIAPHLSMKNRVWARVTMDGYSVFERPKSQGGLWFLAEKIRIDELLSYE